MNKVNTIRQQIVKILKDNESIFEYEDEVADQILQLIAKNLPKERNLIDWWFRETKTKNEGWNDCLSEIKKSLLREGVSK